MHINQIIKSPTNQFQDRHFLILREIGVGGEAEVHEAKVENQSFYQTNVAIKLYNQNINEQEEKFIDWILQKKDVEQGSFLVKIYEKINSEKGTLVVMELGQISLQKYLITNKLSYNEKKQICLQVSKAIQFLHDHQYIHRDIKPENFVQFNNQFKLIDFGSIKVPKNIQFNKQSTESRFAIDVGTLQYQAPEIQDESYSQQIDIWSLGCMFYEIFKGEQLFQGNNKKQVIQQQKEYLSNREMNKTIQKINEIYSSQWSDLIIKMLDPNPQIRPKIIQVINEIQNMQIRNLKAPTKKNPYREFILAQNGEGSRFYQANEINNSAKYTIAIYGINTINEEVIDWLISKQDNNSKDPPLYTFIHEKFIIDGYLYLVMEQGQIQLQKYLIENRGLSLREKELIILDISKTIQQLHQNNYCHTAIHLDNYYKINKQWKLAEFESISKYYPSEQDAKTVDIFRLGCLFYYILQGKILFESRTLLVNQKLQINSDLKNFLKQKTKIEDKIKQIKSEKWQYLILSMITSIEQSISSINLQQVIEYIQKENDQMNSFEQLPQELEVKTKFQLFINSILEVPTEMFPKRQFILTKLLGDGGEGGVFLAQPRNETIYNTEIAIKIQTKMKSHELQFIDFLINYQKNIEQTVLLKSNLIRVYERFENKGQQILIMELGGKDLYSVLKQKQKLSILQKEQICQQIAQSIAFLHKNQMIHRDIKPEDFIQIGSIYKLIDFGLIKKREENLRQTLMVGSPLYQAPEIIQGSDNYSSSVDIWSLGCLFYELFKETPLFDGSTLRDVQQQINNYCQNQSQLHLLINQLQIRQEYKNLIKQMIDPNPQKRPNIDQVQKEIRQRFMLVHSLGAIIQQ